MQNISAAKPEPDKRVIDLHIHSLYSDGHYTVPQIIEKAMALGLSAIAVTDHDSLEGFREARRLISATSIELVPGVELSTHIEGVEVHILGYLFDEKNAKLNERLQDLCTARRVRVQRIVQMLNGAGLEIRLDRVMQMAKGSSVGRPHIAQVLLAEEYVQTFTEAFEKYLGNDRPFYLPVERLTSPEAIQLIRDAGGVSVMAHPGATGHDEYIPRLAEWGLDGLEVFYPKQAYEVTSRYRNLCAQYGLLLSGGSDAHGMADTFAEIGTLKLTYPLIEKMRERIRARANGTGK